MDLATLALRGLRAPPPPPPPRLARDQHPEPLHRVLSDLLAYEHWWEATNPVEDEEVAEDADWHEEDHPRQDDGKFGKGGGGTPKAAKSGKAAPGAGQAEAPPAPKLPEIGKTPESKERYKEIKDLAGRIEKINAHYGASSDLSEELREKAKHEMLTRLPMHKLQAALNDLWDTRMPESGKLSKADQKLNDTLQDEVRRRFTVDHDEREKRARDYAYMDDDEFYKTTRLNFGGDSRMKPGMKAQLGRLPASHIKKLGNYGMTVQAVQEIKRLSESHPYAPALQPAGLFSPAEDKIEVADQVSLPDGSKRMLYNRQATLRHEVGHAIDRITELSFDADITQAVYQGIQKMTPAEREAAAYYLGEGASNDADRLNARRLETFAELYTYAYNDGSSPDDEYGQFGGMSLERRFELFGRARQVLRRKLAEKLDDLALDQLRRAA